MARHSVDFVVVIASVLVLLIATLTSGGSFAEAKKIQPETTLNWDLGVAYTNLLYSYAAYCSNDSLSAWNCKWCQYTDVVSQFRPAVLINNGGSDTFGYVGVHPGQQQVVVVFRGTVESSLENWITDLSFAQTTIYSNVPNAEVHEGFYDAYLSVSTAFNDVVHKLMDENPGYQLVVTGHSLGGALATLCAINLTQSFENVLVYTYGCPRVGNQYFANFFNNYIGANWRVTNFDDIVPHLPPEDLGFYHTTTEQWYDNGTWVACSSTNGEDPYCADSVSVLDYSIEDHLDYFDLQETC